MVAPLRKPKRPAAARTARSSHIPAPVGGFNSTDAAVTLPQGKAVYLYNLMPGENGLRPRPGSTERATLNETPVAVRSMLSFKDNAGAVKRFAVTVNGIYDVTAGGANKVLMQAWPIASGKAGYCVGQNFSNGTSAYLLVTDEENGYWVYDGDANTWAAVAQGLLAGQIDGADPTHFAFVTIWKGRVWFITRGTGQAWYLPVGQMTGTVSAFNFGNKFTHGGYLVGLWSWTQDGGAGTDDRLVAVSSSGDVLVYEGTDPNDPLLFGQKGMWNVGAVPPGRRIVTDFGGDVFILSVMGVLSLSKLTRGSTLTDPDLYATKDVSNLYTRLMDDHSGLDGWALVLHPRENAVLLMVPALAGDQPEQLAFSLSTRGWFRWRGLDMASAVASDGSLYFGTSDSRVVENTGDVDDVRLATAMGTGIPFAGLTSYQTFNNGNIKRGLSARPMLVCSGAEPNIITEARYDFDLNEILTAPNNEPPLSDAWVWAASDVDPNGAVWDDSEWVGTFVNRSPTGLTGMGAAIAIGFRGTSFGRFSLVGWNVTWDEGGPT